MENALDLARQLSDGELVARVKGLAAIERGATVELLAHLGELEARGLHLAAGYGSMFAYCCEALRLSEHAAYHRIEVARAARRFPLVLELLDEGALNLTTVKLLARHLTASNHLEVLAAARGRTRAQVEQIVARLAPLPDVPATVRKLPVPKLAPPVVPEALTTPAPPSVPAAELPGPPAADAAPACINRSRVVTALSPERYRLQLTIGECLLEKLRLAKDLLRHAVPSGDDAEILDRAMTTLLAELAKEKFAATDRPLSPRGVAAGSRHIPAEVKRAVFLRDLGRCAYVGAAARRCNERAFVEFHHVRPYAYGGTATIDNIELRCRRHNGYEWQRESDGLGRQRSMLDGG